MAAERGDVLTYRDLTSRKDSVPSEFDDLEVTGPVDVPVDVRKAAQGREAIVVVLQPASAMPGHRYTLARDELLVGRRADADIPLDLTSVSRRHARFYREGKSWWVEDLGSTNGTFVNEAEVQRRRLSDGDMVRFGEAVLKFLSGTNIEAAYHEEIYRLAILDGLTGVHNRRFFSEVYEREVARCLRHGSTLALVLFDIDRFKAVNDTHGHLTGDAVLVGLCRRLKARIRRDDMLARIGGEEFACLLADTAHAGAVAFAESLRQLVEREPIVHDGKAVQVTISLGVATLDPSAPTTADELMALADTRLYAAKNAGRNRVVG